MAELRSPAVPSRPEDRAGAILTVDLAALVENWRLLKRKAPGADMGAVVKADAYGLGLEPVARALQAAGCATFYVAHIDEGIALRQITGASARIVVMHGPNPGTERDFAAHRLVPVLSTPIQVKAWRRFAEAADMLMESVVQVDTGMNRLGLTGAEFTALLDDPDGFSGLTPLALMSHLAVAEVPAHPLNAQQHERFDGALARFRLKFGDAKGSLVNSSGIFLGPAFHYQLARPGAALYGVNPTPGTVNPQAPAGANPPAPSGANPMIPVVRLSAKILQVRRVDAAAPVGYGATFQAPDGAKLATVSMGYADGLLRSWGAAGHAYIDELKVPVAGRVSMDLTTFDVSAVPQSSLGPGAMIDIIGSKQSVDDLARASGTIGYEILTALGRRYHRRYLPATAAARK
jgi:alanine racemase